MNNEKNIYVEARKQSNLTQAKASEAMQTIRYEFPPNFRQYINY